MNINAVRIKRYIGEIKKNTNDLRQLIVQNDLTPDSLPLKAAKYILIELAEAMANTVQHILAKEKGIAVSGYIDTFVKGKQHGIISDRTFQRLKPFFDFRNSLIHRYWTIDDNLLITNIKNGVDHFDKFVQEIEDYLVTLST